MTIVLGFILSMPCFAQAPKKANAAPASESAGTAQATPQATTSSGQYKIGVVVLREVFKSYDKVKKQYDELQADVKKQQDEIDVMSKRIEDAKTEYEKQKESMSQQDRVEREAAIQKEFREYTSELQKRQGDVDAREEAIFKGAMPDIKEAVAKVGAEQAYHLVLDSKAVLYSSPTIDMTQKVIDVLNSGSGAKK